jgi:hypothetical protein
MTIKKPKKHININYTKLGGGLLAAGPLLMQFSGVTVGWWVGLIFIVVAPMMMSIRQDK